MVQRFFIGVFQFEELSAQRPCFLLRALQLTLTLLIFLFPLRQDLDIGIQVAQFHVHHIELSLESLHHFRSSIHPSHHVRHIKLHSINCDVFKVFAD